MMCSKMSLSDTKPRALNTMMMGISCLMYGRMPMILCPMALFLAPCKTRSIPDLKYSHNAYKNQQWRIFTITQTQLTPLSPDCYSKYPTISIHTQLAHPSPLQAQILSPPPPLPLDTLPTFPTYRLLTPPPLAIMLTHRVLVGLEECSRHDLISVLKAYLESFCWKT